MLKACKKCRIITELDACPICNSTDLTKSFEGSIIVFNPEASEIAKAIGAKTSGRYALKIK